MKTQSIPFAGVLLIAFTLASGCDKTRSTSSAGGNSEDQNQDTIAKVDHHGDEIMASTKKAEARAWMKQPKHVFFKADPKQAAQFVEDFYGAGAPQVLIADIEEEEGAQYGEALLVVLPTDKDARTKLFEIGARADTQYQNDPVADKGQKYLYYSLD